MTLNLKIALVGDYHPAVLAHRAIPFALARAAERWQLGVGFEWVPTEEIDSEARIDGFDGLWCVPASPYRSMDGALLAIRTAREQHLPFLGTCGGFQHAVIEYARHVLGWIDAEHAETAPGARRAVISALACGLVEVTAPLRLAPGSRLARAYGGPQATEGYHCNFGINPDFRVALVGGPLRVAAEDDAGEVRAVELDGHPFFVATLFQPERAGLRGEPAPVVEAFVHAAACHAGQVPVERSTP